MSTLRTARPTRTTSGTKCNHSSVLSKGRRHRHSHTPQSSRTNSLTIPHDTTRHDTTRWTAVERSPTPHLTAQSADHRLQSAHVCTSSSDDACGGSRACQLALRTRGSVSSAPTDSLPAPCVRPSAPFIHILSQPSLLLSSCSPAAANSMRTHCLVPPQLHCIARATCS